MNSPSVPSGFAVRQAAFRLLSAILWQFRPLDAALPGAFSDVRDARDRALARAIVSACLRWLDDLDRIIDSAMDKPLPHDARARMALRIALAQLLVLGTPAHAVVSTALPLVRGGPRRLVHAVLSRLTRAHERGKALLPDQPELPAPYDELWSTRFGNEALAALQASWAHEAELDLQLRDPGQTSAQLEAFAQAGIAAWSALPGHLRLPDAGRVESLPGFQSGEWWVQDLAATLPARLLGATPDAQVLDLCAAPGGKTMQLAAAGAQVTAVDVSVARLRLLRDNLRRTGLAASVVEADALRWSPKLAYDAVLLDAPCSATGTYRRHPDVLHLKAGRPLDDVTTVQAQLLTRSAGWVRPGGRLVYAVCSLEAAEGPDQVAAFLQAHPDWTTDAVDAAELPGLEDACDQHGWVQTRPGAPDLQTLDPGGVSRDHACDGFFIARLRAPGG